MKKAQQAAGSGVFSCKSCKIIWAVFVLRASRREIVVVDGLSIHVPPGKGLVVVGGGVASYIDRLQIDKCRRPRTRAHICTRSCLAWKPIEAGPDVNYLFFSRGLVTVIRVRVFFLGEQSTRSNEENWPLYRALQAHLICFVVQQV